MCEEFLACCFPCCFVMSKRGCGSECCVNFLLGWLCFLPAICHACTFVGKDGNRGVGDKTVVTQQSTIINNVPQQQPIFVQMAPAPGHGQAQYYGQQPIQAQPGSMPSPYYAHQPQPGQQQAQPMVHQFQPEAPPMYSPKQ